MAHTDFLAISTHDERATLEEESLEPDIGVKAVAPATHAKVTVLYSILIGWSVRITRADAA